MLTKNNKGSGQIYQVHHFADDTNLLYLTNSIKNLNKVVNTDENKLVNWLYASLIPLNVKNTEKETFESQESRKILMKLLAVNTMFMIYLPN